MKKSLVMAALLLVSGFARSEPEPRQPFDYFFPVGFSFWENLDFPTARSIYGLDISPTIAHRDSVYGIGLGLICCFYDSLYGMEAGLLLNTVNLHGMQIGGACVADGGSGIQAGIFNAIKSGDTLQIGAVNAGDFIQVGGFNNEGRFQFGAFNFSSKDLQLAPKGLQIGVINVGGSYQIGAFNFAGGFGIGAVNFYKYAMPIFGW